MKTTIRLYSLDKLLRAIRESWTRETSVSPEDWSRNMPSTGQCAVTALVLQNFLEGSIKRCDIESGGSHYWILLGDGEEIDITSDQFGGDEVRLGGLIIRREKLLANTDTTSRYEILRGAVEHAMAGESGNFGTQKLEIPDITLRHKWS